MESKSIWTVNKSGIKYKSLNKNINTDVLIVGGGITGISIAYHLINKGIKVSLIERNRVGEGISARTTGKLTFLQDNIYTKLCKEYSFQVAKLYYESQKDAIKEVVRIVNNNKIECDLEKQESYLFSNNKKDIEKIKIEKLLLEELGEKVYENKKLREVNNYYNISVSDTYYFHPLKYIKKLATICNNSGIDIYENTSLMKLEKKDNEYICYTNKYSINANKVVIASHYPYFLIPFFFPIKNHIEKSYIGSIDNKYLNKSGININKMQESFRYYKDNYIYLNGTHNLAFKYNNVLNFNNLLKINNFKNIWSNTDIITNDRLPFIGEIKDNLYIATGYNTWGMTNGSISGIIISDLILNKPNKYQNLFNPKRKMSIITYPNYFINIFSSIKPFIHNKIIKNKPFYSNNIKFYKENGKNIGVYIDNDGHEHKIINKCPHLGCSLIFNEIEKTWDCPCHSSRFNIDGKCITGPSNSDISIP